ncbi:hypothetical protein Asi03nite_46130 [Actinoplanes siamensis]|uniref:DUF1772 domain-containing protein n=1 Tax=Actinoplanes siamensis TaxID=1223317 RepID=A0A919TMH8_9ACTN|nr:DUF1772 domain-containing protein [Actinoplanes siamensis]GIF07075.1 hypothetical protein Asi03nite_46130 [Actinoplanes siamensis]
MTVTTPLIPVVLLAAGLAAGVMMWTQLGGWPLLSTLPPDRYVYTHAFFAGRYDPFMPACMLVAGAGDVALAVLVEPPPARWLFALAGLLGALCIAISISRNVPVNRWIRTLDPDNLPADFAAVDPRRSWGGWNRLRAVLSIAAFALNCLALTALL